MDGIKVVTDVSYTLYHPGDLPPSDANVWSSLAHPKQKFGKKKNRRSNNKQKDGSGNSNALDGRPTEDVWPDGYALPQHSLVDVSSRRLSGMCLVMGDYRRAVRSYRISYAKIRPTLDRPKRLITPPALAAADANGFDSGELPTLNELYQEVIGNDAGRERRRPILGLSQEYIKSAISYANNRCDSASTTTGGESAALNRLSYFLGSGRAATADRARAGVATNDDSSKLSVHLAMGTLSPRKVYEEASKSGEGAKWLMSHLEMRDYFIYYAFRSGVGLFRLEGAVATSTNKKGEQLVWRDPSESSSNDVEDQMTAVEYWICWATGRTGFPLVDAAMRELLQTGYCSNRVRQNAASFLTKDIKLDWRAGAELFQFLLDDFCVAANWGNWAYFSGVGSDPKSRHFRTISQALRYDPDGTYVQKWHDDLKHVEDKETLFRPWDFLECWPKPIVDPQSQFTWADLERFEKMGQIIENDHEESEVYHGNTGRNLFSL